MKHTPSALGLRRHALREARHFVYRCMNSDGDVVYIGCTHDVAKRWKQHHTTGVAAQTSRMRVTVHPNRAAALEVERDEIALHEPALNHQLYLMNVEAWPREKLLARLRRELTFRRGLPFVGDANSAITTIRRIYRKRFDTDPFVELGLTA